MYKPIGWKNRAVEYARRYEMTQGERSGLVYLKPAPGEVDNQGTPVNAENLNHMDEGILNLDQNKVNATDGDVSDTVATFDQNPTTAPENIASGDRLGTLFGKIYNVIKDFFSHKSDKEIHTTRAEKNSWNNSLSDAKTYADAMYSQLTGYTDKKVADLIGGAPETLDTIEEVATAIKENENVVKALDAAIGKKANQNELDTHISNDSIHVDAAKQAKWDGYEQRITDINNNLTSKLDFFNLSNYDNSGILSLSKKQPFMGYIEWNSNNTPSQGNSCMVFGYNLVVIAISKPGGIYSISTTEPYAWIKRN